MSYDEHLISMAGGDGETVDQLAAIEARAQAAIVERESNFLDLRQFAPVIRAIDKSSTDVPALLALVRERDATIREEQAKLDRVEAAIRDADRSVEFRDVYGLWRNFASIRAAITATEVTK